VVEHGQEASVVIVLSMRWGNRVIARCGVVGAVQKKRRYDAGQDIEEIEGGGCGGGCHCKLCRVGVWGREGQGKERARKVLGWVGALWRWWMKALTHGRGLWACVHGWRVGRFAGRGPWIQRRFECRGRRSRAIGRDVERTLAIAC
jgi:hypothetical protein